MAMVGAVASQFYRLSDFGRMIVLAALLHLAVLIGLSVSPSQDVQEIPVRSLSITLGEDLSRFSPAVPIASAPTSVAKPPAQKPKATPKPAAKPAPKSKSNEVTFKKKITIQPDAALNRRWPQEQAIAAPTTAVVTSEPSHFVRAPIGAASNADAGSGAGSAQKETNAQIKARYEQTMSGWLQRHRVVPEMARKLGQHGTPVLRVRIVRSGAVKYFAIERGSGYELIDQAAMDMVRRANPFPAVPENYQGGEVLEFLIPVTFDLK